MALLQIKNLNFRYPNADQNAVEQLNLTIHAGEFVVLCGESGCGKSTLLRLIKKEIAPFGTSDGEILYQGKSVHDLDDRTAVAEIGFVFQNPEAQIVTDKVWHELAFGLENLGTSTTQIRRITAEMAGYFGIEPWFHRDTDSLSGGQKQLLNLAAVMAMKPNLLLLDEPTAQLDPIAAAGFLQTLRKLNQELGLTILLAEHRLEEVFPIADRVILMEHGTIRLHEPPRSFRLTDTDHPIYAALPAAMQIGKALGAQNDCPLTVREGRAFLADFIADRKLPAAQPVQSTANGIELLRLEDIWFRYEKDSADILRGTSFSVYQGEHFCMLGGNGSGKSTLLRVIASLLRPYSGKICLKGKKLRAHGSALYQNMLALLPQDPQTVFLEQTLYDDLAKRCSEIGLNVQETEDRIHAAAAQFGLTAHLQKHPYDLSGGEQQKAALAKILLLRPKLLLLDEPTKGIDAQGKADITTLLRSLCAEGMTIITVTHDIEFAAASADRCAMFFDGNLIASDTPKTFFSENTYYTTAAHRIARGYVPDAVLCEDIIARCRAGQTPEDAHHGTV